MKYYCDLSKHPLLQQCHEVSMAIEACGASEALTNAVVKSTALLHAINDQLGDAGLIDAKKIQP